MPVTALAELADRMRGADFPLAGRWAAVHTWFESWIDRPGLPGTLRDHIEHLPPHAAAAVVDRSRETTTHFAWCLRDRPDEPFTFWLHEYKPLRDWRSGYADSVHNHRYHFCTTILRGRYRHERHTATVDPVTGLISSTALVRSTDCGVGASGFLLADDFHRIPSADDGTMTFLVKSRPVRRCSLSYDPRTRTAHRHVPVESRLEELARRL